MAGMLRDALENLQEPEPGKLCKVGRWLETLDEDDRADADAMFSLQVTDVKLTETLKKFTDVSRDTVRLHRAGRCGCRR